MPRRGSARTTTRRASSTASSGPFDQWPSGMGFQYFYGFMGGETDQWEPYLFQDHTQIFPWIGKPGYNLTTDMADEAIAHMRGLNAAAPDQPFFVYYVPGGSHSPHQPKKEWIEKFKGKFDKGWNVDARGDLRQPEAARRDPAEREADPVAEGAADVGLAVDPARRSSTRARPRSMPATRPTPTTRSAASSRPSRTWASSTTR